MTIISSPRDLPQLDEFIEYEELQELKDRYGRAPVLESSRICIDALRQRLLQGAASESTDSLLAAVF